MLRSLMQTEQIVALLIAERTRLDAAIQALQSSKRRGRPAKKAPASTVDYQAPKPAPAKAPVVQKRKISGAARKAMANAAKKRWAAIKAGKAPNPFGKKARKKPA